MRIDGAIPASLYGGQLERPDPGRREEEVSEPLTSERERSQSSPDPVSAAENGDENKEAAKGVLRLLQEGHFKGVADVRLRINFFDALAAIERDRTAQVVSEKIDDIVCSVTSTLESGEPTEAPVDALIESFQEAVQGLKQEFLTDEARSADALMRDLESEVDELVLSLTEALTSTEAENPAQEGQPVETETGHDTPAADLVARVRNAFSSAVDELTEALSGVAVLPELSEPQGKGAAYDKFLKIYNEMQASRAPVDFASDADPLDTSA